MEIEFVKGHCGWDVLTLVPEGIIPADRELEAALKIVDAPVNGGLEVGFMGAGEDAQTIRLRMVSSTQRDWIPMCGGMTQVIGKALVETFFRDRFRMNVSAPRLTVRLATPSGMIPLEIDIVNRRAARTTTVMDGYAGFLYDRGVEPIVLNGIEAIDTSEYLVFDIAALERAYSGINFRARKAGPHLEIINGLLKAYQRHRRLRTGTTGMMYESGGEGPGSFRIYPRFWSEDGSAASIPYEFQCGTGTVAVGIALAHRGLLSNTGPGRVVLEWGSRRVTPDPYGIRTSDLDFVLDRGRLTRARFSHSVVEVLAEGRLHMPGY